MQQEQTLTERELGHALFYALKINDLEHAEYLLSLDAPVNTSFFLNQETLIYTTNFMVGRVAEAIKKYSVSHARSQLALRIMDRFVEGGCDFRCHCSPKNPHYCAMSRAFQFLDFRSEDDLLIEENLLILKLLFHGATYKNHDHEKAFRWNAIGILNSYIDTKKDEVVELIKMNRHAKGCFGNTNRHSRCVKEHSVNVTKTKI